MKHTVWLFLAVGTFLAEVAPVRGQVADVGRAFANIPAEGQEVLVSLGDIDVPDGGHLQGIQLRFEPDKQRHLVFLSHDSATLLTKRPLFNSSGNEASLSATPVRSRSLVGWMKRRRMTHRERCIPNG